MDIEKIKQAVNDAAEDLYKNQTKNGLFLSEAELKELKSLLGPIKDGANLVSIVRKMNTVRLQNREYRLSPGQIKRIKEWAFKRGGHGVTEQEATKAQAQKIVNAYIKDTLDDWILQFLGEV